jgi:hypothetical protein
MERVQEKIPLWRGSLPVRRNVFGEKSESAGGRGALIDVFGTSTAKDDPALKEAARLNVHVGMPEQTISETPLNDREYSLLMKTYGPILKASLHALVKSPDYADLPDADKAKLFKRTRDKVRELAYDQVFPQLMQRRYPEGKDVDPETIRKVMGQLGGAEAFKRLTPDQKEVWIRKNLQRLGGQ